MRTSLISSLALAGAALLISFGAKATPIHVGITGGAGQHSATFGPFGDPSFLTLSAWQYDPQTQAWLPAYMTDQPDANSNDGLGVCATDPSGNNNICTGTGETNYIDSIPQQMIDMDISLLASNWTGLTITLLAVDQGPMLTGATCSLLDPNCVPTQIQMNMQFCSAIDANGMVFCNFSAQYLMGLGITDIWIESLSQSCGPNIFATTGPAPNATSLCNGKMLLGSGDQFGFIMDGDAAHVPEPSALGLFGLGTLLLGLFVGMKRRRTN